MSNLDHPGLLPQIEECVKQLFLVYLNDLLIKYEVVKAPTEMEGLFTVPVFLQLEYHRPAILLLASLQFPILIDVLD